MKLDIGAIRHFMKQTGMDSKKMAYKMGTTRQAVCAILGKEACSLSNLGKICKILGVTPNDILTEDEA